jgi:hypothetical protein
MARQHDRPVSAHAGRSSRTAHYRDDVRLFPAVVTMPDGTRHRPAKIVSTTTGTAVYGWDDDAGGVGVVLATTPHPVERDLKVDHYRLTLDDGTVALVVKECGCTGMGGHPLKRWQPPGVLEHAAREHVL